MNYLSVCSGVEAASLAWESLGWEPVAFSEIEKFPSAVLAHHWPEVPNMGDMTKYNEWNITNRIDLLVGGTPCQAFSVAGLRQGLEDPRGNLTLTFLGMVEKYRPRWVVWENVPGVLSDRTNAFGQFLSGLGELGYKYAYRVLDAQHFGVPQRRRRVFVVASIGSHHPGKVLFEPESMCGDITPSREAGEGAAAYTQSSFGGYREGSESLVVQATNLIGGEVYPCLDATTHEKGWCNQAVDQGQGVIVMGSGQANAEITENLSPTLNCNRDGAPIICGTQNDAFRDVGEDLAPTLRAGHNGGAVTPAFCNIIPLNTMTMQGRPSDQDRMGSGIGNVGDPVPTLSCHHSHAVCYGIQGNIINREPKHGGIITNQIVRRLTPLECERLQGFPDNHTRIPWRGKAAEDCPDGPRYKACGNSMAVPVMRWIGERIAMVYGGSEK